MNRASHAVGGQHALRQGCGPDRRVAGLRHDGRGQLADAYQRHQLVGIEPHVPLRRVAQYGARPEHRPGYVGVQDAHQLAGLELGALQRLQPARLASLEHGNVIGAEADRHARRVVALGDEVVECPVDDGAVVDEV